MKSMSIHTIANTILEVMSFRGTSNKTQPHHTCISYTIVSTTKISYTICITKVHVYTPNISQNPLANSYFPSSEFLIILSINPRILNFNP